MREMFVFSYPPSVNRYYRHVGAKVLISKEGREYRDHVAVQKIKNYKTIKTRVSVSIYVWPPDKRKRDLDNILKALLDAIVHAGVLEDDSLIDDLHVYRMEQDPKCSQVMVIIDEAKDGREQERG